MWKYIRRFLPFAILTSLLMVGEVLMDLLQPEIMETIVDEGVLGLGSDGVPNTHLILTEGIKMVLLVLFGGFCGVMSGVCANYTSQSTGNEIRKDEFRRIMHLSFSQADKFTTGSLITRVTNDITQTQDLIAQFIRGVVRTSMLTFGSIIFMFRLRADYGRVMLICLPFLIIIMAVCLWKGNPLFVKLQAQLDRLTSLLQEDLAGMRVIKASVREETEKTRFRGANAELVDTQLRVLVIFSYMTPVINIVINLAAVALIYLGAVNVSAGSAPGVIMAGITYTATLLNGVQMLARLFQTISRGMASWTRVKEVLNTEPALEDGTAEGDPPERGTVSFRDVSFTYGGSSHPALSHISFDLREGETLAITGATGSGKTSLIQLIPRFYDVSEGQVLVDGRDVRDYQIEDLRSRISLALQKSELFSASIRDNLLWGRADADDAAVKTAAETAQAAEFINKTEDGYDTAVAERGASLSGGQKQRLSIARALLKGAEILILDDATSALDVKTEAALYDAMAETHPGLSRIVVAQRAATLLRADRILVLDEGGVAGIGTHKELMRSCPIYQEIYEIQMGNGGELVG